MTCNGGCGRVAVCLLLALSQLPDQANGDAAIVNVSYVASPDEQLRRDATAGSVATSGAPVVTGQTRRFVSYCAAYNPHLSRLPTEQQEWTAFKYLNNIDLCNDAARPDVAGTFIAALRSNCTAYDQGWAAEKQGARGLLIGSTRVFLPGQPNASLVGPGSFPVLVLQRRHLEELEALPAPDTWRIAVYALDEGYGVDASGICLIILALVVIAFGSYRSGAHRLKSIEESYLRSLNETQTLETRSDAQVTGKTADSENERASVSFGPIAVVVFALFMAGLLVLMYFFYQYLVFVFIGLFTLGATSGMYECFKPILTWTDRLAYRIPCGRPDGPVHRCCGPSIDIRAVILLLASLTLALVWLVYRNAPFSWILLDLLGSFLLVSVLTGIQLPSLKACSLFLCLLFIYDVFFVFITPFLTKDGQSVMIQVATGGGGYDPTKDSGSGGAAREVIPAAFKVPHNLVAWSRGPCEDLFEEPSYSLLGFGDVMVPGFLLSYLRSFELVTQAPPVYFIWGCVAYLLSLVVTTVALIIMHTGQPALLYIVPILLLTVVIIGWRRKELNRLWMGNLPALYESTQRRHTWPSSAEALAGGTPGRVPSSSALLDDVRQV